MKDVEIKWPIAVLFLGSFRWFRKLYGGPWVRATGFNPTMPRGPWLPHKTDFPEALQSLIEDGSFIREEWK